MPSRTTTYIPPLLGSEKSRAYLSQLVLTGDEKAIKLLAKFEEFVYSSRLRTPLLSSARIGSSDVVGMQ